MAYDEMNPPPGEFIQKEEGDKSFSDFANTYNEFRQKGIPAREIMRQFYESGQMRSLSLEAREKVSRLHPKMTDTDLDDAVFTADLEVRGEMQPVSAIPDLPLPDAKTAAMLAGLGLGVYGGAGFLTPAIAKVLSSLGPAAAAKIAAVAGPAMGGAGGMAAGGLLPEVAGMEKTAKHPDGWNPMKHAEYALSGPSYEEQMKSPAGQVLRSSAKAGALMAVPAAAAELAVGGMAPGVAATLARAGVGGLASLGAEYAMTPEGQNMTSTDAILSFLGGALSEGAVGVQRAGEAIDISARRLARQGIPQKEARFLAAGPQQEAAAKWGGELVGVPEIEDRAATFITGKPLIQETGAGPKKMVEALEDLRSGATKKFSRSVAGAPKGEYDEIYDWFSSELTKAADASEEVSAAMGPAKTKGVIGEEATRLIVDAGEALHEASVIKYGKMKNAMPKDAIVPARNIANMSEALERVVDESDSVISQARKVMAQPTSAAKDITEALTVSEGAQFPMSFAEEFGRTIPASMDDIPEALAESRRLRSALSKIKRGEPTTVVELQDIYRGVNKLPFKDAQAIKREMAIIKQVTDDSIRAGLEPYEGLYDMWRDANFESFRGKIALKASKKYVDSRTGRIKIPAKEVGERVVTEWGTTSGRGRIGLDVEAVGWQPRLRKRLKELARMGLSEEVRLQKQTSGVVDLLEGAKKAKPSPAVTRGLELAKQKLKEKDIFSAAAKDFISDIPVNKPAFVEANRNANIILDRLENAPELVRKNFETAAIRGMLDKSVKNGLPDGETLRLLIDRNPAIISRTRIGEPLKKLAAALSPGGDVEAIAESLALFKGRSAGEIYGQIWNVNKFSPEKLRTAYDALDDALGASWPGPKQEFAEELISAIAKPGVGARPNTKAFADNLVRFADENAEVVFRHDPGLLKRVRQGKKFMPLVANLTERLEKAAISADVVTRRTQSIFGPITGVSKDPAKTGLLVGAIRFAPTYLAKMALDPNLAVKYKAWAKLMRSLLAAKEAGR